MFLLMAVPNCQWGNIKYTEEDGRDHIGIGAWSSCSKSFEESVSFLAPSPVLCSATELRACSESFLDKCTQDSSYDVYVEAWHECKPLCSATQWVAHCQAQDCAGTSHNHFCTKVFEAVQSDHRSFTYGTTGEVAWNSKGACQRNENICNNYLTLAHAGNLALMGILTAIVGQCLLLSYVFIHAKRDMGRFLLGAAVSFGACWVFLLAAWVVFANALGVDVECKIMAQSGKGAVIAVGKFGDIVEAGGSFSYHFIVCSWVLSLVILAILIQRIATARFKDTQSNGIPCDADASVVIESYEDTA